MKAISISGRKVGSDYPPLVIAEIGINHNGSLEVAKEMVDAAKNAGCEVVKFQSHVIHDEMSHHAKATIPGNADISIYDIMEQCALSEKEELEIKTYVENKGMIFLSTPFSRKAAERLESIHVEAFKIGSGECNNYPLVEHIAKYGKPVICSTGMNSLASVKKTAAIFEKYKTPYALLHCTNIYPTPPNLVRLGAMQEMMNEFPDIPIGLSDHTLNNAACLSAIAMGACIVERHFTDSKNRSGPDIICSMTPQELKQLNEWGQEIFQMRGGHKEPVVEEKPTIDFAYASVVSIKPIKKGELLSYDNLWVKRPGTGEIMAAEYESMIGKIAIRDILEDEQIKRSDFSG
jgi:N-acetylneuraminate synthase